MQNKGVYQHHCGTSGTHLRFLYLLSFVTSHYEKKAEEYAARVSKTHDVTNDVYKQKSEAVQ